MKHLSLLLISIVLFSSCNSSDQSIKDFDYGTESDSSRIYYKKGWEEIMDNGRWTLSETYFRKAMTFDADFLIGKSLVGRITQNLDERLKIFEELEASKSKLKHNERLIFDIFLSGIHRMNNRDQNIRSSSEDITNHMNLSEINFRTFVHKYPEESYIKAEYIEILHARHGAKTALDSMAVLANQHQKQLPFYITYGALLKAELKDYRTAISDLDIIDDSLPAKPYTLASIYYKMDSLNLAKQYIDKAIHMDKNHLIAQGLKTIIDKRLNEYD
ncbi:hypothetical protein [Winogradskyella immobilis]|uniref:Tetratricopeptide repeat protein n=1 Tax=Winogradskyella immobilis TaxID=2816852 RepID=A0ABS8EMT8_9FLAO|nr:hypothetical protein [Winogradskyella immobilis]MCC1484529.1 hypothetical protein [Winogradskyella immobilis]MCG0016621.1 hypothetical protein [Winogradskyella immobilis]